MEQLKPSPKLAYVIAAILGDGSFYERRQKKANGKTNGYQRVVKLEVTEKNFAESVAKSLEELGFRVYRLYRDDKRRYYIRVTNKELFFFFKALTPERLASLIDEFESDFLKGFYEAEGHYKLLDSCPTIIISNTNKNLINVVVKCLEKLGIKPHVYGYQITICRSEDVKRFLEATKPCIKNAPKVYHRKQRREKGAFMSHM